MNDLAQQFGLDFLAASWLPQVLTVIGAVVAINVVAHYLLRHIEKLAARSAAVWDDALIKATRKPIVADVKAMLQAHPEIDTSATLIVNFNQFGASSLDFFTYTFTRTVEWMHYHEVKQDVLLKIAAIIRAHGAEIAFPTRTLHLEPATREAQTAS